jgi:hypothetical protein
MSQSWMPIEIGTQLAFPMRHDPRAGQNQRKDLLPPRIGDKIMFEPGLLILVGGFICGVMSLNLTMPIRDEDHFCI